MSKLEANYVDEDLLKRLPLPLAQVCRRAQNAKTYLEQHQAAYYCWEIALKLLASAAIVEYAELQDGDPQLTERLRNLARPSLGNWWEFVRRLVPILADRQDAGFAAVRDLMFSKARSDLPRCAGLDAALRGALDNKEGARSTTRLSELFDRLVQYRNLEIGHGASGQKPAAHYERMAGALLGALGELLSRLDVLAGRRLVFVVDVRRQNKGSWLIERLELTGEAARRIESRELAESQAALLPRPEMVYLKRPAGDRAGPADALPMSPLVLFEQDSGIVLFLNAQRGKKEAEFLCYHTGQVLRRELLLGDQRELFTKIFGDAVNGTVLESWAAKSMAEEGPAPAVEPRANLRTIGEFELLSKIDQGGMGVVYRAWQPSLNRPVALKALLRFGDPKSEQRFAREIRALGRVEHPNLVKIFTSGSDGDNWFYAMELVDGANLASIWGELAQGGRSDVGAAEWHRAANSAWERARSAEQMITIDALPPRSTSVAALPAAADGAVGHTLADVGTMRGGQSHVCHVADIIRQAALAAHALNEAGVIHRDIKPGNIMLAMEGTRAVLMDLGLAQLADDAEGRLTRTRQFVGTLRYASPEQLLNAGLDRRTDVYSLGATLWELLTLRPIYDITEAVPTPEIMQRIQTQPPVPPRKFNRRVPYDLETIVLKCLEKDAQRRYATAGELADDLDRFLRGEPVRAQPPTLRYLLGKYVHKHRVRLSVAAAAIMLIVLGTILAFVQITTARNDAVTANAAKGKALAKVEVLLENEKEHNEQLAAQQYQLQHQDAENFLVSAQLDLQNWELGLGMASLLAAYEAAPKDDPLRWSIREMMAGWEPSLAPRFLHDDQVEAVAFHPSGKFVMTAGWDKSAHFWDVQTGLPHGNPDHVTPGARIWAAVFSPKGEWLATGDDERRAILWDMETRKPHGTPMQLDDDPLSLAFSADGKWLATGCGDSMAKRRDANPHRGDYLAQIWNVATQEKVGEPFRHTEEVLSVAFNPAGTILATGSNDKYLRLWDIKTGKLVREPILVGDPKNENQRDKDGVWTVSFSPDGKYLFAGARISKAGKLFNADTLELVHDRILHEDGIIGSVFSSDSKHILIGSRDKSAQLWDVATGKKVGQKYTALRSIRAVALSPSGKDIITGSHDGAARLFRDMKPKPEGPVFKHKKAVLALAVSSDGQRLATGCADGVARLWNFKDGERVGKDMRHDGPVTCLAFSADGTRLVSGSSDRKLRKWNAMTGEQLGEAVSCEYKLTSLALIPDSPLVLVGGLGPAYCYDLDTRKQWKDPLYHADDVRNVAVTPDGKLLITGSRDRTIRVWNREKWQQVLPANEKPMRHDDSILALAVDPQGKFIVSGSKDNTARRWSLDTLDYTQDMTGHEHHVINVAISYDSKLILTVGESEHTTRLWDAATGKQIGEPIKHNGDIGAIAFLPDGTHFLVGHDSGDVDMWAVPTPFPDRPEYIRALVRFRSGWTRNPVGHRRLTVEEWQKSLEELLKEGGNYGARTGSGSQ